MEQKIGLLALNTTALYLQTRCLTQWDCKWEWRMILRLQSCEKWWPVQTKTHVRRQVLAQSMNKDFTIPVSITWDLSPIMFPWGGWQSLCALYILACILQTKGSGLSQMSKYPWTLGSFSPGSRWIICLRVGALVIGISVEVSLFKRLTVEKAQELLGPKRGSRGRSAERMTYWREEHY